MLLLNGQGRCIWKTRSNNFETSNPVALTIDIGDHFPSKLMLYRSVGKAHFDYVWITRKCNSSYHRLILLITVTIVPVSCSLWEIHFLPATRLAIRGLNRTNCGLL